MPKMPPPTSSHRFSSLARPAHTLLGLAGAALLIAACSSEDPATNGGGNGAKAGTGGKSGASGKAGNNNGGSTNNGGNGGSGAGPVIPLGGAAGAAGNATGGSGGNMAGGNGGGTTAGTGGTAAGGACAGPAGPIKRECRPLTDNECDGMIDKNPKFKPEGMTGNGFDDDCDGLVDEGCGCEGAGKTKDCFLVPSSQTTGAPGFQPPGWCAQNSKGKVECKVFSGGLDGQKELKFKGECIGAQPPKQEICEPGDFNCDGLDGNAPNICECQPVVCPDPLYTTPFPDPNNIGQFSATPGGPKTIQGVNGATWFKDPSIAATAKNWRWTLVGGSCDDILPNPTFAAFPTNKGTPLVPWSTHLGLKTLNLPTTPDEGQPSPTFPMGTRKGWIIQDTPEVVAPNTIFPAFSLSGDYYVTGKFQYAPNPQKPEVLVEGQCTQIVKVRAPGLRVELCWPEVGPGQNDNDVDLHVARLQGNTPTTGKHGWFVTAGKAPNSDDCYYSPNSSCGNRIPTGPAPQLTPGWYDNEISEEPGGVGVCHGWGSRRFDTRPCTSPRLDRDNIDCDPTQEDPNAPEQDPKQQGDVYKDNFCGPENINLDAQVLEAGQRFAIGVECYGCVQGANGAGQPAHPRVNIYCDGEFKQGAGYDQPEGSPQFPALLTEGRAERGAFWNVGIVTWNGTADDPCSISTVNNVPAWNANPWREAANGSANYCVQNGPLDQDGANYSPTVGNDQGTKWQFTADGGYPDPANPNAICAY